MPTGNTNKLLEAIFGRGAESNIMKIKVRDGTPVSHSNSLCHTCSNAMYFRGAAVSEKKILCSELKNGYGTEEVPYEIIVECTSYQDKSKQSLYEMKKIAYILKTDPRGKPIGFMPNKDFRAEQKKEGDDVDVLPGHYD